MSTERPRPAGTRRSARAALSAGLLAGWVGAGCRITDRDVCEHGGDLWDPQRRTCHPTELSVRIVEERDPDHLDPQARHPARADLEVDGRPQVVDPAGMSVVRELPRGAGPLRLRATKPGYSTAHSVVRRPRGPASVELCVQRAETAALHASHKWSAITRVEEFSWVFPPGSWVDPATEEATSGQVTVSYAWAGKGTCAVPGPTRRCGDGVELQILAAAELLGATKDDRTLALKVSGEGTAQVPVLRVRAPNGSVLAGQDDLRGLRYDPEAGCWADLGPSTAETVGGLGNDPAPRALPARWVEVRAPGWVGLGFASGEAGCHSGRLVSGGEPAVGVGLAVTSEAVLGAQTGQTDLDGRFCIPTTTSREATIAGFGRKGRELLTLDPVSSLPGSCDCVPSDGRTHRATVHRDRDGDGFLAGPGGDCDDADRRRHPGSPDPIDPSGIDANCDGVDGQDDDRDGAPSPLVDDAAAPAEGYDCAPTEPRRAPARPERCDGIDNDCDGSVDDGTEDLPRTVQGLGRCWPCTRQSIADLGPRLFWSMEPKDGMIWDLSGFGDDALPFDPAGDPFAVTYPGISDEGGEVPWLRGLEQDALFATHTEPIETDELTLSFWLRAEHRSTLVYALADDDLEFDERRVFSTRMSRSNGFETRFDLDDPDHPDVDVLSLFTFGFVSDPGVPIGMHYEELFRWQHLAVTWNGTTEVFHPDGNVRTYDDGDPHEEQCLPDLSYDEDAATNEFEGQYYPGPGAQCFPTYLRAKYPEGAAFPPRSFLGTAIDDQDDSTKGGFTLAGQLDDLALFDRWLSEEQVQLLHQLTACGERCGEGGEPADEDGDGPPLDENRLGTAQCPASDCEAILDARAQRGNGVYCLASDGETCTETAWCDFTTDPPATHQCGDGVVGGPYETCDGDGFGDDTSCTDCVLAVPSARTCRDVRDALVGLGRLPLDGEYLVDGGSLLLKCLHTQEGGGWTLAFNQDILNPGGFAPPMDEAIACDPDYFVEGRADLPEGECEPWIDPYTQIEYPCGQPLPDPVDGPQWQGKGSCQPDPAGDVACLFCDGKKKCQGALTNNLPLPSEFAYSNLSLLEDRFRGTNGFEFLLWYPRSELEGGTDIRYRWIQQGNPVTEGAAGYQACPGRIPKPQFGGLVKNTRCIQNSLDPTLELPVSLLVAAQDPTAVVLEFNADIAKSYALTAPDGGLFDNSDNSTSHVQLWVRPAEPADECR